MRGDDNTLWPVTPDQPMFKPTICATLGEIYRLIEAGNAAEALPLVNIAHDMAKRMNVKLKAYAEAAGQPSWYERGFFEQSWPDTARGKRLQQEGPRRGRKGDPR
jgi:hypothetical protein